MASTLAATAAEQDKAEAAAQSRRWRAMLPGFRLEVEMYQNNLEKIDFTIIIHLDESEN